MRGARRAGRRCSPGTSLHGNLPVTANAIVTAGLMWLPDTWPSAYTVATTTVAERERDHAQVGHRERGVAVHDQRGRHRPDPDEHEQRGPQHLGRQLLRLRVVVH